MIHGITFADEKMSISADKCRKSMFQHGVNEVDYFKPSDIDLEFVRFNSEIFIQQRGYGFWLWKPYFIYKKMLQLSDGHTLIYSDAGIEFVNSVRYIIEKMDEDIFFFTNTHPQFHWCKKEVMLAMNIPERLDIGQAQASVIFFKVNQKTIYFVKEWLLWSQMPGMIDDSKLLDQCKEFQDHRHDQSILTNLIYKHNYKMHWWPTAYAEHIRIPGDNYPVMFNHHRFRDPGKGNGEPEWK